MSVTKPLVSVVIPMYNAEESIENTLKSVVRQSYENLEVIVINDGSNDSSLQIANACISRLKMENVIVLDKLNGGVSSARNAGMKIAKGEFIAFLDSDDEWLENKIELQIECFKNNPQIDLLGGLRKGEHLKRFLYKKFDYLTKVSSRDLLYKVFFCTPTIIFKKKILEDIGFFDENLKYGEDGNYLLRICDKKSCFILNEGMVITKGGKPDFGHSGLSANLKGMQSAIIHNLKQALSMRIVSKSEYVFLRFFSNLKYVRRILLSKYR